LFQPLTVHLQFMFEKKLELKGEFLSSFLENL